MNIAIHGLLGLALWLPLAHAEETVVEPELQQQVIVELQQLIGQHYVLNDGARRLVDGLQQARERGDFDAAKTQSAFIKHSNGLMQAAFPDRHLGLLEPTRYRTLQQRFHPTAATNETGADKHGMTEPAIQAHAPVAPGSHAQQSSAPHHGGHDGAHQEGESSRAEKLLAVAGVSAVAEISRDGLNQIGYLALQRLDGSARSSSVIKQIFETFSDSDRLILDLRQCAGGDVEMVEQISSYLYDKPTHLVSSIGPKLGGGDREVIERWTTPSELSAEHFDKPVDVLISSKSFSAAESLAFGLSITNRARLIGQPSGGGGHMNDFYPLPGGFGASISIGRTYDPRTGKGWEASGVVPDVLTQVDHALSETIALITLESGKLDALDADQTAVYAQIQDYATAWYRADDGRMAELLDANFQATHAPTSGNSRQPLPHRDRASQITATANGVGARPALYHNRIISQIEVDGAQATARLVLRETIHLLRFHRTAAGWLMLNDEFRNKRLHG